MASRIEHVEAATMIGSYVIVDEASVIVAICTRQDIAHRIAHLWDTHGLADIPDTPAELE